MYKLSNYSAVLQIRTDAVMEGLVVFYVLPWTMIELKTSSHRISSTLHYIESAIKQRRDPNSCKNECVSIVIGDVRIKGTCTLTFQIFLLPALK